ncbi:MAG: hypothetical protein L3K15_06960 [Thermoplasmata archaeon]|nr:hypothetical protein [Thermoplasmata archaeon]
MTRRVNWYVYAGLVFVILSWFYLRNADRLDLGIGWTLLAIGLVLVALELVQYRRRRARRS